MKIKKKINNSFFTATRISDFSTKRPANINDSNLFKSDLSADRLMERPTHRNLAEKKRKQKKGRAERMSEDQSKSFLLSRHLLSYSALNSSVLLCLKRTNSMRMSASKTWQDNLFSGFPDSKSPLKNLVSDRFWITKCKVISNILKAIRWIASDGCGWITERFGRSV